MAWAAPRPLCILPAAPLEEKTIFWMCTVPCSDADMDGCSFHGCSFLNPFLRLNSDPGKSLVVNRARCVGVSALALARDGQLISMVCIQALNGGFILAALALSCGVGSSNTTRKTQTVIGCL